MTHAAYRSPAAATSRGRLGSSIGPDLPGELLLSKHPHTPLAGVAWLARSDGLVLSGGVTCPVGETTAVSRR